ncbi:MAG: hypothetical protein ABSG78_02560 [Verrucomicrobiota bacterium]|jgi:hypothetical protein
MDQAFAGLSLPSPAKRLWATALGLVSSRRGFVVVFLREPWFGAMLKPALPVNSAKSVSSAPNIEKKNNVCSKIFGELWANGGYLQVLSLPFLFRFHCSNLKSPSIFAPDI